MSVALLSACGPSTQSGGRPAWLSPCHVDGFDVETLCGTLTVPVRPGDPSATLDLRVVVVPAVKPVPTADPLVLLAGGPGQAATEAYGAMMLALSRIQQSRDLIMMDQRGTGQSSPLDCPDLGEDTLASRFSDEVPLEEVVACRDALLAEGHDLSAFTTRNHTHDLEALRMALDVEQWNLYGGSYGTRAALDYADTHPDRVRRLVLDGVAHEMPLFGTFGIDGQAALDAMVAACRSDSRAARLRFPTCTTTCSSSWPATDGGGRPSSTHRHGRSGPAFWTRHRRQPAQHPVLPPDGRPASDGHQQATQDPPHLQPLVTLASAIGGDNLEDAMSMGLMLSVACHEDVHRITDDLAAESADTFLGTQLIDMAREWCAVWPVDHRPLHRRP